MSAKKKTRREERRGKARKGEDALAPTPKNKGGRPEIQPDHETIKNLMAIHCTQAEIATVLGVSRKTVERWAQREEFRDTFLYGRDRGRVSVRRMQFKLLEAGSVAMSIWLGKQLLGQREEVKVETNENAISYAGLLTIIDRLETKRAEPAD